MPTTTEVITTRSDFSICVAPSLMAMGVAAILPEEICRVRGTRAYAINHDGSNPHFLDLDDPRDVDAPVARTSLHDVVERIRREESLDQLERDIARALESRAKSELRKQAAERAARLAMRVAAKASVLTAVVEFLRDDGNPGCDDGPFKREAATTFAAAGSMTRRIFTASVAPHPVLINRTAALIEAMKDLKHTIENLSNGVPDGCKPWYVAARNSAAATATHLEISKTYLREIDLQSQRRTAYRVATEIDLSGQPVGTRNCDVAQAVQDALGRGAGKRNYFVYWAPPPPQDQDVRYVGLSRALDTRCSNHPPTISNHLTTLNLPPLRYQEARNVEEALIAHFGLSTEIRNGSVVAVGQLINKRHEIDPDRVAYCERLLVGQFVLARRGYGSYAAAFFTRNKQCPGAGGPR